MLNEEYIPSESTGATIVREVYDWFESGITAVLCAVLLFAFVGRIIGVVGESMLPTLQDNERLVATRLYTELQSGDIVVVTKPTSRNEPLIKRVIATGGQTVDIDTETGEVLVDGSRVYETYTAEPIQPGSTFEVQFPQTVPDGSVFLLGDNRNNSWDSRAAEVGMVDDRYVLGRVVYRLTPYERLGPVF